MTPQKTRLRPGFFIRIKKPGSSLTIVAELPRKAFSSFTKPIQLGEQTYAPKSELHVSLLLASQVRSLKDACEERNARSGSQLSAKGIIEAAYKEVAQSSPTGALRISDRLWEVAKEKTLQGGAQKVMAKSVVVEVYTPLAENFTKVINSKIAEHGLEMKLEPAWTHVTLYTANDSGGIALPSSPETTDASKLGLTYCRPISPNDFKAS